MSVSVSEDPEQQDLPETICPTPKKSRFATLEAAQRAADQAGFELDKKLYPYTTCKCKWVHLTSKKAVAQAAASRTLQEICDLDDEAFGKIVRDAVTARGMPEEAALLRSPELALRWSDALKQFQIDVEMQLAARAGEKDADTREWRKKIAIVKKSIFENRAEARALCARSAVQHRMPPSPQVRDERRRQTALREIGGEQAVNRLIAAHQAEFNVYLIEEFGKIGAEVPERILRYAAQNQAEREGSEQDEDQSAG